MLLEGEGGGDVRVARGKQLPKGWHPGQPLPVGREAQPVQGSGCPFGPPCYACRNGLQWNPGRGKHMPARAAESGNQRRRHR